MSPSRTNLDLQTLEGIKAWLRQIVRGYRWNVSGIRLHDNRVIPLP